MALRNNAKYTKLMIQIHIYIRALLCLLFQIRSIYKLATTACHAYPNYLPVFVSTSSLFTHQAPETISPLHAFFFTRTRKISRHVKVAEWVLSGLGIAHDSVEGAIFLSLFEFGAQLGVHCSWCQFQ